LIPLKTLKEINRNDEACDTIKKRLAQTFRLFSLQKVQLNRFKRLDSNNISLQRSSDDIEGFYQHSELILRKIYKHKTFFSKVWTFTKYELIPAFVLFTIGYTTGKSG